MRRIVPSIIIIIAIVVAGALYTKYRVAPKVHFADIELTDLDGRPFNKASLKGKKVFVSFFATWCGPCVHEMPMLEQAQQKLQGDNFIFICVADEPVEKLKQLRDKLGVNLAFLHTTQKLSSINIVTYPTNYLLNTEGEVVFKKTGVLDWANNETINNLKRAGQ